MKDIRWDILKNEELKKHRGVSFEEIIQGDLVAVKQHHTRKNQKIMLFRRSGYIWVVPYVEAEEEIFLKTLFPSRKYTRLYKQKGAL